MDNLLEGMVDMICGANLFSDIYDTLSVNLFSSGGAFGAAYSVVRAIYNSVMSIGVMLLFVYFTLSLVDKMSSDSFTWEQLWRQLAWLLAGKYIMENGFEILELLFNIGMAVAARISALGDPMVTETAIDAAAAIEELTESFNGFFAVLGKLIAMVILLFPWLLAWVMKLAVNVICYSRVIEIYARVTLAPVALSDLFRSGLQGAGWRYLKSFLAVALQGALILIIGIIYSAVLSSVTISQEPGWWSLVALIGKYLVIYASAVMLMFKSQSLAKELVGVN